MLFNGDIMRRLLILLLIFVYFVGQTYSKPDNINERVYMIKPNNITSKNISLLDDCIDKIVVVYPEDNYNLIKSYVFNYKTINQNTFDLERLYLNKINRISSTEYYKIKLKGIKIKYIKAYANSLKIKKCNNYLEKVEPL